MFDGINESVDVLFSRVEVETRADGRWRAKEIVKDLGAVIARAAGDSFAVKECRRILSENIFDVEGDDARFGVGVLDSDVSSLL